MWNKPPEETYEEKKKPNKQTTTKKPTNILRKPWISFMTLYSGASNFIVKLY